MGGGADFDGDVGAVLGGEEGAGLKGPVDGLAEFGPGPALVSGGEQSGAGAAELGVGRARSAMPTGSSRREPRIWARRLIGLPVHLVEGAPGDAERHGSERRGEDDEQR